MRHHLNLTALLIVCVYSLSACTQSASVGIPTPDRVNPNPAASAPTTAPATPVVEMATLQPTTETPTPQPQQAEPAPTAPLPEPTAVQPSPTEPAPTAITDTSGDSVVCNKIVIHIVKPGENLFRIGLRYKTSASAIARRNGITDIRKVRTGTQLRILTCA